MTNNIRHPETAPKQSVTRRQRTGPSQGLRNCQRAWNETSAGVSRATSEPLASGRRARGVWTPSARYPRFSQGRNE